MELKMWIFYVMLLASLGECLGRHCQEEYTCMKQCYRGQKTYTKCGVLSWARCTKYKLESYTCAENCTRTVCCEGYAGNECNTHSSSPIVVISILLVVVTIIAVVTFLLIRFRSKFDSFALLKGKRECILDNTDEAVTYFADDGSDEVHE